MSSSQRVAENAEGIESAMGKRPLLRISDSAAVMTSRSQAGELNALGS